MDLAEKVLYYKTFFTKPSVIALTCVVALYREKISQWINKMGRSLLNSFLF